MNKPVASPEYYINFIREEKSIAEGRTFDKGQAIQAIQHWMKHKTLEELYAAFLFVDKNKRQLQEISKTINGAYSQLQSIDINEVTGDDESQVMLQFGKDSRRCQVTVSGHDELPYFSFFWDECEIFSRADGDFHKMAGLIKRWVVDSAMPSEFTLEFPGIEFGVLATYYEQGKGIEGEMMLSWDQIERFYQKLSLENVAGILSLIRQMRDRGFDKTLRAGQSLYTLILSRSRRHGMRDDQDFVAFDFRYIKTAMEIRTRKGEHLKFDKIEYSDRIDQLLKNLELQSID